MSKYMKHIITALAGIIIGLLIAMGTSRCNRKPTKVIKVERDTIVQYDTVPHYYPKPIEVAKTKIEYRWLTRVKTDTILRENYAQNSAEIMHDSVLVEVPIESRHYHGEEYDAYISGYLTSLDSIFVRQRTEYITERVTVSKPPNRWELDLVGGINYNFNKKKYTPHIGGELLYKPNRFQVVIRGGIEYTDKVEPAIAAVAKIRLY